MLNQVVIQGRIVKDPELRQTSAGVNVASFTIAHDRDGKREEKVTDFVDCVAWRTAGEYAAQYLSKGQKVVITGHLQVREWTDKDGNKRRTYEVNVDHLYPEWKSSASGAEAPAAPVFKPVADEDGDLPF